MFLPQFASYGEKLSFHVILMWFSLSYRMGRRKFCHSLGNSCWSVCFPRFAISKMKNSQLYTRVHWHVIAFFQSWQDEYLVWDETLYPTVWGLTFPVEDVWTPDVNVANRQDRPTSFGAFLFFSVPHQFNCALVHCNRNVESFSPTKLEFWSLSVVLLMWENKIGSKTLNSSPSQTEQSCLQSGE